jgi:hypothetical protein
MFLESSTGNRSWFNTSTSDCILSTLEATTNLGGQCTLELLKTLNFEGGSSLITSVASFLKLCSLRGIPDSLAFVSLYFISWIIFEATLLYAASGIGSTSGNSSARLGRDRKLFRLKKKIYVVLAIAQVIALIIAFFFLVGTRNELFPQSKKKVHRGGRNWAFCLAASPTSRWKA